MMSAPATAKDGTQGSGGRKTPSGARQAAEQGLKCPRCDSPNTKFCYYNNYSLTQPRHFCKTCRRYWTKGGALRNVPIGGGCRKNKKVKSTSRLSSMDCKESGGSFFHQGLISPSSTSSSSSVDFQLGGGIPLPFPRLQNQNHHPHLSSSFGEGLAAGSSGFNLDPSASAISSSTSFVGFNYPFNYMGGGIQGMTSTSINVQSSLASSIESLSFINQDLHCKLQQQRLATLFGGDNSTHNGAVSVVHVESQKRQPVLFQNLEISNSKPDPQEICAVGGNSRALPTEWFLGGSSYASSVTPTPTASSAAAAGNGNDNGSITNNWTTGVHAWGDVQQQYGALP